MRQSQVVFLKFLYFQFKFFLNFVLFFVVLRLPQFRFFFPIFQILADLRLSQVAQFFRFCFPQLDPSKTRLATDIVSQLGVLRELRRRNWTYISTCVCRNSKFWNKRQK